MFTLYNYDKVWFLVSAVEVVRTELSNMKKI